MIACLPIIDTIQARGSTITLTGKGELFITQVKRLTPDDMALILACKTPLIRELKTIRNLLNRVLPPATSTRDIMAAQDAFGLWVLLQAAQSEDRAFEQETVTAALRIYNDRTGAPELRESA